MIKKVLAEAWAVAWRVILFAVFAGGMLAALAQLGEEPSKENPAHPHLLQGSADHA